MAFQFDRVKGVYAVALAFAALFIVLRMDFLAVAAALMFIVGVIFESMESAKKKGVSHEIKEIVVAIAVAVLLWFGSSIVLNTPSPYNAVVSCSMLPTLQRGDVVVLLGGEVSVPEINLTRDEFEEMLARGEEHYVCGFCGRGESYVPCTIDPRTGMEVKGKILRYKCGVCKQYYEGEERSIACTEGVYLKGTYFDAAAPEGDIIVYKPRSDDLFAVIGDIIHRAIVKINVDGDSYYLIKGDNNPMFDVQAFDSGLRRTNSIVHSSQLLGKHILTIPVIGYVKLVAAGQFATPENCKTLLSYKNSTATK